MTSLRRFTFTYSPLVAIAVVVLGLYAMAIAIGFSMGVPPVTANAGCYRIFFVPNSVK